jgi:hypothetical protein
MYTMIVLSLFHDGDHNLISHFMLYLETYVQVTKLFMFMLPCFEQSMDRSTVLEHTITHQVGSLRWNQRTARASYTDVQFSLAAQL